MIVNPTANLQVLPYLRNLFYDLSKNAAARLAWAMAQELREQGIAVVAVAPGFMRTERVVEAFRRAGAESALDGPGGPKETTAYLGRAVVALATDPRVIEKTGGSSRSARSREYGFTDVNGTRPEPFRIPGPQGGQGNQGDQGDQGGH